MLFIDDFAIGTPLYLTKKPSILSEAEGEEDSEVTDYTADDNNTEDTGNPVDDTPSPTPQSMDNTNPTDNPDEYTLPDNESGGDNPPPGEGTGATTTDYTVDSTEGTPDTGNIENPNPEADNPAEGQSTPTDYTTGDGNDLEGGDQSAEGGEDPQGQEDDTGIGGEDEGGNPSENPDNDNMDDDYGSDSSSDSDYNQQIQDLEKDIYDNLTEPQMDIRSKELKRNFVNLYDAVNDIIERINDISKDSASIKPLEFVSEKLTDLADRLSDYLSYTFSTKSYTENEINYNIFLAAIDQINDVLEKIHPNNA